MTTELDTKIVPKVISTLARVGVLTTFVTATNAQSSYNPSTGIAAPTEQSFEQIASPPVQVKERLIDGDLIRVGDCEIILQGQSISFTPVLGMKVTSGGSTWRIVAIEPVRSGDLIAAYVLRVRK